MPNYKEQFGMTLKVDDIRDRGLVRAVVERIAVESVGSDERGKENKLVAHFVGKEKGLVLNRTNADVLAGITGSDNTDNWAGAMVLLYVDPNVMYGGKRVGGIRIKAVNTVTPPQVELPVIQQRSVPAGEPVDLSDIPF